MALTLLHEISPSTLPRPVKAVKNGRNHAVNSALQRLHSGLRVAPLALAVLVAFGFSQTNTFAVVLSNGQLSIDIREDNGTIDTALLNGKDFFNDGIPVSDWGMQNGTDTTSFVFNDTEGVTQQPVTVASTATTVTVTGTYTAGGSNVAFSRVYRIFEGVNALTVVTALTNNATSTINLRYFDSFDPDQGSPLGLGPGTVNDVLVQSGIPVARSTATNDLTFTIGSIFGESSILASGNPFQINNGALLNGVVTAPFDGNGATADNGQHLVYVRSIAPGQTVVTHGVLAFGDTNVEAITDFVIAASSTGPGVSTDAPTSVTLTSATLNGSANPYNMATTAFFVYGTDPTLLTGTTTTSTQSLGSGSAVVPFSEALTGLTPDTTYYYLASGTNLNGTNTGSIASFTTGPDIAVEQPLLTNLVDGSASVGFPDALVETTTPVMTFTIRNVGNPDLTGLSISKDGADSDDFTVSGPVSTTVVGGGSTTFTVSFTPGALGARTAAIHIASNDVDENSFDINLTGNGVATLPAYTFGEMGMGSTGFNGNTFGSVFTAETACTVKDLGAYDHGQDGLNASMPVGIWSANGTLLASTIVTTSDTLVGFFRYHTLTTPVALTAGQQYYVGAFVADGSDAVGQSPASFTVDPRITFNGTVGLFGSFAQPTFPYGSAPSFITSNFRLSGPSNAAPTDIALTATSIAESNAANATVGNLSTTDADEGDTFTYTLVAGTGSTDNASFTISGSSLNLTPTADYEAKNSYAVRVRTTDAGELLFEKAFTITVTPGKPKLDSINPTSGSSTGGTSVTFTGIRFTGATGVTIGGTAATNVVVVNDTTITCTTPAGTPGTASVVVTTPLGSNAANTLYTYLTPEITIRGKGVEIASGDTTPSVGDDTDFGSADITGGTVVRTFTIGNSGNDALVLTGTPKVSLTGASEFSVTTQPTSPVALEGEPKTFTIAFAPTSFGTKNAVVTIASDDLDEASYTFAITGSGNVPPGPAVTYNYDIPKLSYTTGCLEHIVRLTNKAQGPIGGVRLTVTNLPPGYVMYNATDKGLPPSIVVYKAIAPESAVEIRVQYYSTSRTIVGWRPEYRLEPVLPVTIMGESFVPALGGMTSFNVRANSPWKVSLSQKWASVSSPTSGNGNGSFTVTVQPFTSAKPAQRTLLIKIPGAEDFLLTQTGVDKPELGQMLASYNTVVGVDYELAVPTQNAPVTYTATGLPTGLKLGTDGWITGTPTKDGSFNVKVSARNAAGSAAPVSFIINVAKLDVAVVGAYHGYMERSSSVQFGPAANLGASFLMTTTATGAVTGKLTEGGTTKSFEGKLTVIDSQPRSYAFSTLIKGTGNTLAVTFDTVSSTLEGSVTSESNSGTASRSRASVRDTSQGALVQAWRAADNATAYAGRHNFTITSPPTSNPTFLSNGPAGYGYGSLTVNAASRVITIAGKLADGSALTGTTVAGSGSPMKVLVYQSLYGNRGSFFGQLRVEAGNINLLSGNVVSGSLDWMKPATNQSDTVYSAGFGPLSTVIEGASYTPPAKGQLVGDFSPTSAGTPNASLLLEAGGLPGAFSQLLRIANPSPTGTTNTAVPTLPNANGLTFTAFDAATGVFAGSFKQGVTGSVRTALFYGQLNRFGSSYGFFLLPQGTASNAAKLSGKLMVNGYVP